MRPILTILITLALSACGTAEAPPPTKGELVGEAVLAFCERLAPCNNIETVQQCYDRNMESLCGFFDCDATPDEGAAYELLDACLEEIEALTCTHRPPQPSCTALLDL